MELLTKAIEEITYSSRKFPKEAFQVISEHWEEALEKAIKEGDALNPGLSASFLCLIFLS